MPTFRDIVVSMRCKPLGVSERISRRWRQRFEDAEDTGLLKRRPGKTSGKREPLDREQEVEALSLQVHT
jgi:hypothetical protein